MKKLNNQYIVIGEEYIFHEQNINDYIIKIDSISKQPKLVNFHGKPILTSSQYFVTFKDNNDIIVELYCDIYTGYVPYVGKLTKNTKIAKLLFLKNL